MTKSIKENDTKSVGKTDCRCIWIVSKLWHKICKCISIMKENKYHEKDTALQIVSRGSVERKEEQNLLTQNLLPMI